MKCVFSVLALVAATVSAWDVALRDAPIVGDSLTYLDGTWHVNGAGFSVSGSVPGDLFSDLENAKVRIGEIDARVCQGRPCKRVHRREK
jgi:hypothetical protein